MTQTDGTIFAFKEKSWEPVVAIQTDGALIYQMPVASGHFDKHFSFQISQAAFDVLKADEERRYFLYAALHSIYQSRPQSSALQSDPLIRQILCGTCAEVETALTLRDAASNGAVSNLIRILMDRDQEPMRNGRWFQVR